MKLAVELSRWGYRHQEGKRTVHYRVDEVTKLLHIHDRQWREAYQRVRDNLVKLEEQTLHSAKHEVSGGQILRRIPKPLTRPFGLINGQG